MQVIAPAENLNPVGETIQHLLFVNLPRQP